MKNLWHGMKISNGLILQWVILKNQNIYITANTESNIYELYLPITVSNYNYLPLTMTSSSRIIVGSEDRYSNVWQYILRNVTNADSVFNNVYCFFICY